MPKISVIIPIFNKEKYIKKSLESVINQSFKDFEIIIIDDGSTDKSAEIIGNFKDKRIHFFQQENKGVSYTRNRGVSLAKSDLIAFLDADDIWFDKHLQTIVYLAEKYPYAQFFGTAYQIKYNDKFIKKFIFDFNGLNDFILKKFYKYIKGSPIFYTSNFGIRKDIFEKEKGFRTDLHGEDTELFYRLGFKYNFAYSKAVTLEYIAFSENSLFANYETDKKTLLLEALKDFEKQDKELKRLLDLNRFAWILEYLEDNLPDKANNLKKEIDYNNLNFKQKLLLSLSGKNIIRLKKIQKILIKNKIYISPFSKS